MGRWLHNIVDPKAGNSGIIGYTCDSVAPFSNKTKVCEQRVTRMTATARSYERLRTSLSLVCPSVGRFASE